MKTKRNIITIDEVLCNGCGNCVKGCHEGALQMIDGKARIVSELYCDGLGACIGECPVGAITIEQREAESYDEVAVMQRISQQGGAIVLAHLKHLKEHGETNYLRQGIEYIQAHDPGIDLSVLTDEAPRMACGCPGSMARSFVKPVVPEDVHIHGAKSSELSHWPVQLHLINPGASYFAGADILLAADCTAFAFGDFHNKFLRGRKLVIACPKLDSNQESYIAKITELIDSAQINTLTVVIMEVPCCNGLMQIAQMAVGRATRKVPVKRIIVGVQGEIKAESWV